MLLRVRGGETDPASGQNYLQQLLETTFGNIRRQHAIKFSLSYNLSATF
jgi:hypothetical protein